MSTFKITPEDVGRRAVTRGGKIGSVAQSPYFSAKYPYAYQIRLDSGSHYSITEFGKYRIDSGVPELDVVAWLDEPIASPRPQDLRDEMAIKFVEQHMKMATVLDFDNWWKLGYEFADAMMKARGGK